MINVEEALRKILAAAVLRENSWDENHPMDWRGGRYTKSEIDCFLEVCESETQGQFLYLASSEYGNDLEEMARDLGFGIFWTDTRTDPPTELDIEEERKKPVDDWVPIPFRRAIVRDLTDAEKEARRLQHELWERERQADLERFGEPAE